MGRSTIVQSASPPEWRETLPTQTADDDENAMKTAKELAAFGKGELEPSAEVVVVASAMFAGPGLALFYFLRRHPQLAGWAIAIGLCLVPLGLAASDPSSPLAACATLGLCATFIAFESRRQRPSMTGIFGLAHLSMIALYIPIMAAYPTWFARLWMLISSSANLNDVRTLLVSSAVGWGVGVTGFLGALDAWFPIHPPPPFQAGGSPTIVRAVGISAFALLLISKGGSYLGASTIPQSIAGTISSFDYLYYVTFYAAAFAMFQERKARATTIIWIAAAFALELISGSKGRFFTFVLAPLATMFSFANHKVEARYMSAFIAILGVSVFVIFPILVNYREDLSVGRAQVENAAEGLQRASERSNDDYVDKLLTPVASSNSAEQVNAITSIINARLEEPPSRLATRVFFSWVPRFVWPEKPMALSTNEIGRATGRVSEGDEETAVLTTGPAELYMYFGVFGGFLLVVPGFMVRALERRFAGSPTQNSFHAGVWLFLTTIAGRFIGGDFEGSLTGLIQQSVVLLLLLRIQRFMYTPVSARASV